MAKAQRQNTRTAFSAYLAAHPNGRHAESARARMAGLEALDAEGPAANGVTAAKQGAQTSGLTKSEAPPPMCAGHPPTAVAPSAPTAGFDRRPERATVRA